MTQHRGLSEAQGLTEPSCRVFSASRLLRGQAAHLPEGPQRHSCECRRSAAWLHQGPEANPNQSNANREGSSGWRKASGGSAAFRRVPCPGSRRPRPNSSPSKKAQRVLAVRLKSKINRLRPGAAGRGSSGSREGRGREVAAARGGTAPVRGPETRDAKPRGRGSCSGRGRRGLDGG